MTHVQKIEKAFGFLATGSFGRYDGNENKPTGTIFVCSDEISYSNLRAQGGKPMRRELAASIYKQPVEENMTQFEFH